MNQALASGPPFDADLVRAVALALNPGAVVSTNPIRDLDPEAFAYLARYWHVAASLWLRLRNCPGVPAFVRDQLREEYWRNVQANASLQTVARYLFATLNAQGVVPMLLKGGCQLFDPPAGHAGTRFMVDLDLLTPPGQDRIGFDTLCQQGFVPAEGWDTDRFHHWPKLTRPADGLVVEIHKAPWLGAGAAEADAFFAASTPIAKAATNALLPCAGHRLLHNAVHAFDGRFGYLAVWAPYALDEAIGSANLRQLLDFVELCWFRGDEFDWGMVFAVADRFGRKPDLQQWSSMARELFAVQLPEGIANWNVDRPELRSFRPRCRHVARAALHKTGLLGPLRRGRSRWFK